MAGINFTAAPQAERKQVFRAKLTDQEVALLASARQAGMTYRQIAQAVERWA
jgi:hypothetical protein